MGLCSKRRFCCTALVLLVAALMSEVDPQLPGFLFQVIIPTTLVVIEMRIDPGTTAETEQACRELQRVANLQPSNKDWMLHVGAVEATLSALRKHTDHKGVQMACAEAVSSMALYNFKIMEYAGRSGAVELVVDMFKRWPSDPNMQRGGISGCFMDFSYENRLRFQNAGGVEVLLSAIENHFDDPQAVVGAWYGFSSGTQDPNSEYFVMKGGMEAAIRCMRGHGKSDRVREEIMQAMRQPLRSSVHRATLADAGYISDLVTAMKDAPMDYHTIAPACANLNYFAATTEHRAAVVKANATQEALAAVVNYPTMKPLVNWNAEYDAQYTVYDDCLKLLAEVVSDCEAHEYLVSAGAAKVVQPLVTAGDPNVQRTKGVLSDHGWRTSSDVIRNAGMRILHALDRSCTSPGASR